MDEQERSWRTDLEEEAGEVALVEDDAVDAALDQSIVDADTEAQIRARTSGGPVGDAFLAQAEEAALDSGSVDRIATRRPRSRTPSRGRSTGGRRS